MESPLPASFCLIRVSVAGQWLRLERLLQDGSPGGLIRLYPVSTSLHGIGFFPGSNKTPTGNFRVAKKIGASCHPATIFRGRVPVGLWPEDAKEGDEDVIMTRIMRLEGLDSDNANTWERYIYIHGTNRIDLLGSPASHGCIRMAPDHIIDLFELVPEGTKMIIC